MTLFRTLLCALIGTFFAGCAAFQKGSPEKIEARENIISAIAFPGDSELIMIPVSFKGKEYQFVLDTGASATVFDISLKDQLGWRLPSRRVAAADGKTIRVARFMVGHAHFGGLCKRNIQVLTADLSYVCKIAGRKVDGIVGTDILKDHIVQLDFEKNSVSFLRSSNTNEFSGCTSDMWLKNDSVYMDAKVENIPVRFQIDTGFVDSGFMGLLEPAALEKLASAGIAQSDQASTIAGPMMFDERKTIISNLHVGDIEYENALFVGHHKSLLGLNFLSRHIVTFDFPNKKLYLKKLTGFDNLSRFSMFISGFDFTVMNINNNVVLESVNSGSLGYNKGLRKNDVVVKVNNYDVSAYNLPEFADILISLLQEQDLDHLKFVIKRNGELKEITFFER